MAWSGKRKYELPRDWAYRREVVRRRAGGICEGQVRAGAGMVRCTELGTDCDHKVRGQDHSLSNLQWLCHWHHQRKTTAEAAEARQAAKNRQKSVHPGML